MAESFKEAAAAAVAVAYLFAGLAVFSAFRAWQQSPPSGCAGVRSI